MVWMSRVMNDSMTGKRCTFRLQVILIVALSLCSSVTAFAQGVFLDPTLHDAVRQRLISLGADPGSEVDADEMTGVGFTSFTNNSGLIYDLTGLEYATDLTHLDLASNRIFDITPLAGLRNLQVLSLAMNGNTITPEWLSDYTPLRGLVFLTELDIAFNHVIEDLGFLQDMMYLTKLDISFNKIEDIGVLYNLYSLQELYASFNEIKNISVLGELSDLSVIDLSYNEITDLKALTENYSIGSGDTIYLYNNPLSATARCADVNYLLGESVTLDIPSTCTNFTEQNYINTIQGTQIPDQETLAMMDLTADYQVNVADLILFLNGGTDTATPEARYQGLADATTNIELWGLKVGKELSTVPLVTTPPVLVLAQTPIAQTVPEKSEVNLTVSIPPDAFRFLTHGKTDPDYQGRGDAEAYYRTIDPLNRKDTLAKWVAENGFGQPGGVEAEAVYLSDFDLALGRHMYMRQDGDNIAYYVTNHDTVDDVWQTAANPLATVAMEYSPGPDGGEAFVKFYTFDQDGLRVIDVNLDGRGDRYQPSMCMTCHGGVPGFEMSDGSYSNGGNTGARFIPFDHSCPI
jgi:hypothetical protein